MLGGRTNHWGRISLRFGPHDFQRKTLDGLGDDWPITYDDLKPYYDKIDRFIGVFGTNLPNLPNEPDGIFLPPPEPRCYELLIKQASDASSTSRACPRGCRSSPGRSTADRRVTTARSAAAGARPIRTSPRRRCSFPRR